MEILKKFTTTSSIFLILFLVVTTTTTTTTSSTVCLIENGLNYNSYNSLNSSCYRYNHNRSILLNCESDRNNEWKKNQTSYFNVDQNLIVQDNNGLKTIILEQHFKLVPSFDGSIIINNINEHIAFFQTRFKIENNVIPSSSFQDSGIKLVSLNYTDPYGNINSSNNNVTTTNKDWETEYNGNNGGGNYHFLNYLKFPIDAKNDNNDNMNEWFKQSALRLKSGKSIPSISFTGFEGSINTKWIIPTTSNQEYILLNVTYTSTMSDLVLSGRHIEHNTFLSSSYGFNCILKLNLKTNQIIPFEKNYFDQKETNKQQMNK